jgi:hypothetical protein
VIHPLLLLRDLLTNGTTENNMSASGKYQKLDEEKLITDTSGPFSITTIRALTPVFTGKDGSWKVPSGSFSSVPPMPSSQSLNS